MEMLRWFKGKLLGARLGDDYGPYMYQPTHSVVDDYIEFSGLDRDKVVWSIQNYETINQKAWGEIFEKTKDWSETAWEFYGTVDRYIFDHLSSNPSPTEVLARLDRFDKRLLKTMRSYRGKRMLDFGGGTGVFCEIMTREGLDVTYLDIPGHVKDFAEWRFRKHNLPIRTVTSSPGQLTLEDDYDVVYTDAVFEHLIDPEQALREIVTHILPGGAFVFLVDLGGHKDTQPEHRDIDIKRLHGMIREHGFSCTLGEHKFASVWTLA